MENILEVRNALEITIAQLAAKCRTEEDLTAIRQALFQRQQNLSPIRENTQADVNFHMAIAQACHNGILLNLYLSISSYLEDHISKRQKATTMEPLQIDQLHEELYQSIVQQNDHQALLCVQNILKI